MKRMQTMLQLFNEILKSDGIGIFTQSKHCPLELIGKTWLIKSWCIYIGLNLRAVIVLANRNEIFQ